MGELVKIYDRVKELLEQYPFYRDNDNALVCRIWTIELGGDAVIKQMTAFDFMAEYAKDKLTSSESIYRAKRKVMENHEELRGKSYRRRHDLEDGAIDDIIDLNNK
jgi:hypothetical protein